jgi:hypothetical protein
MQSEGSFPEEDRGRRPPPSTSSPCPAWFFRLRREAELRGDNAGAYWKDVPEIPTVGHFTSMAGALVASYAIGWLTGKFTPPHRYIAFNILAPGFDYVGFDAHCRSGCYCETLIGHADQRAHASVIFGSGT